MHPVPPCLRHCSNNYNFGTKYRYFQPHYYSLETSCFIPLLLYCFQVILRTKNFVTNRVYIFDMLCDGDNIFNAQRDWNYAQSQTRITLLIIWRLSSMITF